MAAVAAVAQLKDIVAPTITAADATAGTSVIKLTLSEVASGKPVASSFTVKDGSSSVTVSSVSIDGAEITLTLGSVIKTLRHYQWGILHLMLEGSMMQQVIYLVALIHRLRLTLLKTLMRQQ